MHKKIRTFRRTGIAFANTTAEFGVSQAVGALAQLMFGWIVFNICLAYNDSSKFPRVENNYADCEHSQLNFTPL
jgi:hypothetical protein